MTYRRYWVYFLLFLFNVICYLDRINMSVAGRSVAQEFALSPVALGYLFSSFLWAYVLMMLPSGRLVDSLGAHRMAAIGAAFWSIAQMLSGAATGFVTPAAGPPRPRRRRGADLPGQLPQRARLGALHRARPGGRLHPGRHVARPGAQRARGGLADRRDLLARGRSSSPARSGWSGSRCGWRFVSTPERTRWLPEPERQPHPGRASRRRDAATAHGGIGYRRAAALAVDVGTGDLAGLRGLYGLSLPELAAELPADARGTVAREFRACSPRCRSSSARRVIILTNWIGDRILTPHTMRNGGGAWWWWRACCCRRSGMAIPFVDSLTAGGHPDHLPGELRRHRHRDQRGALQRSAALAGRQRTGVRLHGAGRQRVRPAGADHHRLHRAGAPAASPPRSYWRACCR